MRPKVISRSTVRRAKWHYRRLAGERLERRDLLALVPQLVADINQDPAPLELSEFQFQGWAVVGQNAFFANSDPAHGLELWKTNAQGASSGLVKDIAPAGQGSAPSQFTAVDQNVFFVANDGTSGVELWKSDGTEAGTVRVKDIQPGSSSSFPRYLANVGGTLFFQARGATGGYELWKSDGTDAGTVLVKDIRPGSSSSAPKQLVNVSGVLFFTANDGTNGDELWRSSGTAESTVLVRDIQEGSFGSNPRWMTAMNGFALFVADSGTGASELWLSDGSAAGTRLVMDIRPGPAGSNPEYLTVVGGILFFTADDGETGRELWKTDGIGGNTQRVQDIRPGSAGSNPRSLANVNGTLFFSADDGVTRQELWKSDGTASGTALVKDIRADANSASDASSMTNVGGTLFFVANDGRHGWEIYKSDGTADGTVLVDDHQFESTGDPRPTDLLNFNGILLFRDAETEDDSTFSGKTLWKSDGTPEGTFEVPKDAFSTRGALKFGGAMIPAGDFSFLVTNDGRRNEALWKTDGTEAGTVLIKEIERISLYNNMQPVLVNGVLFFSAHDGIHGWELWRSDGTAAGTFMVADIDTEPNPNTGFSDSNPSHFTNVNGTLFFTANDGVQGVELWKSDGTAAGTVLVKDIRSGPNSSQPTDLSELNGSLLFAANDGINGIELWKSDGTPQGTVLLQNISPLAANSSNPNGLVNIGGTLYFAATDHMHGMELWKSDGTTDGTILIKDIATGTGLANDSAPRHFVEVAGSVFFAANGNTLWKTDGTESGTVLVKQLDRGLTAPGINLNGALLFASGDGAFNKELWRSDGTPEGTEQLKDIPPIGAGSDPRGFARINNVVYFIADEAGEDDILWKTDGTALGTRRVDLSIGSAQLRDVITLTPWNSQLYFAANDGIHGRELWTLVDDGVANIPPAATPDEYFLTEETPLVVSAPGVLANDSDANGDELWVALVAEPVHGELTLKLDGSFTYAPAANFIGTDHFTYIAHDGLVATAPTTVTLTVGGATISGQKWNDRNGNGLRDPDEPPLAGVTITLDAGVNGSIERTTITAADGTYTFSGLNDGTYAVDEVVPAGWKQTFPVGEFGGSKEHVVAVARGEVRSDLHFGNFKPNQPPSGADKVVLGTEDRLLVISLSDFGFSDPADEPQHVLIAVRIAALPDDGTLLLDGEPVEIGQFVSATDIAAGRLKFAPPADANGPNVASFTFQVQDSGGTADGGVDLDPTPNTLTIDLIPVNDPPEGTDGAVTLAEDTEYVFASADFGFRDPSDSPPHRLAAVWIASLPDNGQLLFGGEPAQIGDTVTTLQLAAGLLRFVPDENAYGEPLTSLQFQVQDDGGGESLDLTPNILLIIVTGVNDPPVARPDGNIVMENGILEVSAATGLLANDEDVDQEDELRVVSVFGEAANVGQTMQLSSGALLLVRADGSYRYDPNGQYESYAQFQSTFDGFEYEMSDLAGVRSAAQATITIVGENDAPIAQDDHYSLDEGTTLDVGSRGVLANDSDAEIGFLMAAPVDLPEHGSLTLRMDGGLLYTPDPGFVGIDRFTYRASDGDLQSELATATLTVRNVNDRPVVVLPTLQTLVEGQALTVFGSFSDPDASDTWTATVDYGDGQGPIPLALQPGKSFVLSHVYRDNGSFLVTVSIRDAGGLIGSAQQTAIVQNAPPASLVVAGPANAPRGSRVVFSGSFSDPGTADTFSGTIFWGDGNSSPFTAGPASGRTFSQSHVYAVAGRYEVVVVVSDDDGGSVGTSHTITIVAADPGPRLRDGVLEITGSGQRDNIALTVSGSRIVVNGTYGTAKINQSFPRSKIQQVVVSLGAGDDALTVDSKLRTSLLVFGGQGNDRIRAGGGPSLIVGDAGNDLLYGGGGRDVLIGGDGRDQLWGYGGSDLLIHGSTSFDADLAALAAILAEWSSGRGFKVRVANLRAATGPILGGTNVRLKVGTTVLDDGVVDSLMGNGDSDWFFATPKKDKLNDKGESLNGG